MFCSICQKPIDVGFYYSVGTATICPSCAGSVTIARLYNLGLIDVDEVDVIDGHLSTADIMGIIDGDIDNMSESDFMEKYADDKKALDRWNERFANGDIISNVEPDEHLDKEN